MITVREAEEADAQGISEVFKACYGKDYPYLEFFDPQLLKRLIFASDTIMVVAENEEKNIVGTASVLEEKGAYSDLVGEFGRLAVIPEVRNQGVGTALMKGRLERVQNRLHVGIIEARIVHPFSTKVATANGFAAVGYLPGKLEVKSRENLAFLVNHFGEALFLRRNHPRIIPEVYQLAYLAMNNCKMEFDAIVADDSAPYPHNEEFDLDQMDTFGYAGLLRIERGRTRNREIFGPMRLHYGFFKLQSTNSYYVIARDRGQLVGAIGFTIDKVDQAARFFELISLNDDVIRVLLKEAIRQCQEEHDILFLEADVSAYSPRMQRTFLELGFLPAAYVPAMVFHEVERLDIVKMVRLFTSFNPEQDVLIPEVKDVADMVIRSFTTREIQPKILEAIPHGSIFRGLSNEQSQQVASFCTLENFKAEEPLFQAGEFSEKIYIMLSGEVEIYLKDYPFPMGNVKKGECIGEVSALSELPRSASCVALEEVQVAVLLCKELEKLIRLRPDIGVIVYKNLAIGLGKKLLNANITRKLMKHEKRDSLEP